MLCQRAANLVLYFISRCLVLAALCALASAAPADELVKFPSAALQGAGAPAIQGYLAKPKGAGPFPAVVLLHSCLGLPSNMAAIGAALASWGYVALFVDDFGSRGLKETCSVDFAPAVADAFGGLAFLAKLSSVDPARIAAVGYSQGADTALDLATSRYPASLAPPGDLKFKAAAAYYPPCANQGDAMLKIPTLILVGAADEVTPAADCERFANAQSGDHVKAKLVVLPGAGHVFDDPQFAGGKRLLGMRLQYDRTAEERAKAELRAFLARTLAH
jgi:dienelactone hydrolase